MPTITEIKLICIALGIVICCAFTGVVVHKVDLSEYQKLELQYKDAAAKAAEAARVEQAALDQVSTDAATKEIATQKQLADQAQAQLARVKVHVTAGPGNCITWGLIRVIDGALLNIDPNDLQLPAGAADTGCAPIKAPRLANNIVANYAVAARNSEQLFALQAYLKQISTVKR